MKKFRRFLVVGMATTMLFGSVLDVSAAGLKDIFDAKYYADSYADLKETFGYDESQLYNHFITYGLEEGRNMSPILDVVAYREAHADLDAAFGDDWDAYVNHFFTFGAGEMRYRGVLFNPIIYADAYDDVKAAYGSDLMAITRHYLIFGRAENRTSGTFNRYADMADARKAAQAARQVTSSGEGDSSETSGGNVPGVNVPGGNAPGGNGENSNKTSVIWEPFSKWRFESEYDERGNCISVTTYDFEGNKLWSTHYTFNSNNELVRSEGRSSEGNCTDYVEYEYDGGKIQKKTSYFGDGKVSYTETYKWNGNTVTISGYDADGNPHNYKVCEIDSRLNFTREDYYNSGGERYAYYVYTYDANDNVLTQIGYNPDGTEVSNQSFTYYENGTKKTETKIVGGTKEIFEYNESGSMVSKETYNNNKLQEAYTCEYYAEGPLAKKSHNCYYYSDGSSSSYEEIDYDRQGRKQKETKTEKNPDGTLSSEYEWVCEFAADGSYTISSKYGSDGKLTSKWSAAYNAQAIPVNKISYNFSDGEVESVAVRNYDEKGRMVRDSLYDADEVTLRNATVYTYVETEYGYEKTIKKLDANGNVVSTNDYMCDANDETLGWKSSLNNGGFVEYWYKDKGKDEIQSWYYTAEGKLYEMVIKNGNIIIAKSEYDENGKETKLEYDAANDKWVKPLASSGTGESGSGESGSDESGGDALTSLLGNDAEGNGIKLIKEESGNEVKPSESSGTGESGNGESDESGNGVPSESGSGESGESGNGESGSGESGGDAFTTVSGNDIAGN